MIHENVNVRLWSRVQAGLATEPTGAAALLVGLAALAWFSVPTVATLHGHWSDPVVVTYSHGYLIVLLAALIAWKTLRRFPVHGVEPSWAGALAFAFCVALMVVGIASSTLIIAQAASPLLLLSAVWSVLGWRQSRPFVWTAAYLYLAVPAWDVFTDALRSATVAVVSRWLHAVDLPAFIDGNVVHLPAGTLEIENGCSGLHYLLVALALASFQGMFFLTRWRSRFALLLVAVGLALLANWLRVFALVLVGHFSDMRHYLVTVDHSTFGWVVFLVVFLPAFWLGRVLELRDARPRAVAAESAPRAVVGQARRRIWPTSAVVVAALAVGVWLNARVGIDGGSTAPSAVITIPSVPAWRFAGPWDDATRPLYIGSVSDAAWFRGDGGVVGVYFAHYKEQGQGRELVFYANRPEGAAATVIERTEVAPAEGGGFPMQELEVSDGPEARRLVWLTMWVGGNPTSSDVWAKVYQAWGSLRRRRDADALVLSAACDGDCAGARRRLGEYARVAAAKIHACAARTESRDLGGSAAEGRKCDEE